MGVSSVPAGGGSGSLGIFSPVRARPSTPSLDGPARRGRMERNPLSPPGEGGPVRQTRSGAAAAVRKGVRLMSYRGSVRLAFAAAALLAVGRPGFAAPGMVILKDGFTLQGEVTRDG